MTELELRGRVIRHYEVNDDQFPFYKRELDFLTSDRSMDWVHTVFPYDYVNEVLKLELQSSYETYHGFEVIKVSLNGSFPIYYPRDLGWENAEDCYKLLLIEQHRNSPHRYHKVPKNCSVIDVGSSEGIFGKLYCDPSNELHCFDDPYWTIPAFITLGNYPMVTMHEKFIEDTITESELKLEFPLGCIKIDVDGNEIHAINSLRDLIWKYGPMIQVAVYHYQLQYDEVVRLLRNEFGYTGFMTNDKYMLYPSDNNQFPPYFRKGVLVASKS